jgi:hypothetical protein
MLVGSLIGQYLMHLYLNGTQIGTKNMENNQLLFGVYAEFRSKMIKKF